jgi:hypothetical protein
VPDQVHSVDGVLVEEAAEIVDHRGERLLGRPRAAAVPAGVDRVARRPAPASAAANPSQVAAELPIPCSSTTGVAAGSPLS